MAIVSGDLDRLPAAVRGDPIVINFTSPINQALPAAGGTITIQGQLTNTSSAPVTIVRFGFDSQARIGSFDAVVLLTPHTSIDYDALVRSARLVIDTHSGLQPREAPNVVNIWVPATEVAAPVLS